MSKKKIVIIGGGAAGFFTAANLPVHKNYDIVLIESGQELMKKIAIDIVSCRCCKLRMYIYNLLHITQYNAGNFHVSFVSGQSVLIFLGNKTK